MRNEASKLSVEISDGQAEAIFSFLRELQKYNEHTNLVGNADVDVLVADHVMDAVSLLPVLRGCGGADNASLRLVDIGSGAGFPAIVLAILMEKLSVVLIDSVGKKTRFLLEAASALGISQRVEVLNARAEEAARGAEYREKFNFATARAVGKLDLVCELTVPFLKIGGTLLAQKSESQLKEELEPGRHAAELMGGNIIGIDKLNRDVLKRDLVVVKVQKEKPTAAKYPRATAQLKKPLG